jgi:hypothetical protein
VKEREREREKDTLMSNTQNEQNEQLTTNQGQSIQDAFGGVQLPAPAYSLPPLARLPGLELICGVPLTAADPAGEITPSAKGEAA